MEKVLGNIQFYWSKTNRWHRVFLVLLLAELDWLPGSHLGFICNDPALSHPFKGDTISWKWLIGVTVTLPFVFIIIVERKYYGEDVQRSKEQALTWYKEYLFGLVLNLTIVSVLKGLVGEPRPHFFDTCGPEEAETCQDSEYVSSYTCTKKHWVAQSDRSFPSGHTSMAIHAAAFIVWYLRRRVPTSSRSTPGVQIAQLLPVASALACSLSRVLDNRHHWWDVCAGAGIAAVLVIYTILVLCKNFESPIRTTGSLDIHSCKESPSEKDFNVNASRRTIL